MRPLLVGAVIYDPKVTVIWETIKEFFAENGCPIDCAFYTNYELQVDALLAGHVHIAWNSPLAWLDAQRRADGKCRAVAMRDTDRDRVTRIVVSSDSHAKTVQDLRGKTLGVGAPDSPQATLLPLHLLHQAGLEPGADFNVRRHDLLVGKHGDHVGGELEALRSLERGVCDAAAILDLNWELWCADGTADARRYRVLASTPRFDHCNFTVLASLPNETVDRWARVLFRMSYDHPAHREMMDLEGLKAWLPGRTSGYIDLAAAVEEQGFFAQVG